MSYSSSVRHSYTDLRMGLLERIYYRSDASLSRPRRRLKRKILTSGRISSRTFFPRTKKVASWEFLTRSLAMENVRKPRGSGGGPAKTEVRGFDTRSDADYKYPGAYL